MMSVLRDRLHLGGTHPFSGGCFPQRAVTDMMLLKNKKRNEKITYLTVCTQDDTAHRTRGSLSPGPPGLPGDQPANRTVPSPSGRGRESRPRVLRASRARPVRLRSPRHRDVEMANAHRLTSRGLRTFT